MSLWRTKRHWEHLAKTDPFWGVLAEPDKQGNRWQVEEFFARGQKDVGAEMEKVFARFPDLHKQSALDFGCGVGRLTQALADHFERVVGIDFSEGMVRLARKHNRHGDRITYIHNPRTDLTVIPDASIDFVYSVITLQHIPPQHAKVYIAEFIRILRPDGCAFFQVPAGFATPPRKRLSLYPPTIAKKVRRFLNKYFLWEPVLEMNVISKEEVWQVLSSAGAEIVSTVPHAGAGSDFISYAYLARKM